MLSVDLEGQKSDVIVGSKSRSPFQEIWGKDEGCSGNLEGGRLTRGNF